MRAASKTEQMPERLKSIGEPNGSQVDLDPLRADPGRFDEAFVSAGRPHPHTRGMVESLNRLGEERLLGLGRAPRRDLHAARHHLRRDRPRRADPRPPVPARSDPADHLRRRVGLHLQRRPAAGPGAEPLRRRRLRRARDHPRRDRALAPGRHPARLRPPRPRAEAARRRLVPRLRLRPGPRRERDLARARGQRPRPLRDLLRAREPDRDGPADAGAVRRLLGPAGRQLPGAAARRARRRRARPASAARRSSSGPRAPPTPPTSSTPSSPGRWASSSSRPPTSSSATPPAT